ncbi:hypothetical protein [Sulfurimonas sp. HSL-1716]|uniref:hypothetical protein n=1 Tax=Hydrocurvibacter sulfurireducens TaxID=3131937 RepID=UPI0031F7B4DC
MKYIGWFFGLILSFIVIIYITAFTAFGNKLLKPVVESKLKENTDLPLKIDVFKLTTNYIELSLWLNEKNSLLVKGTYSLFSRSFDISYNCKFDELQSLASVTKKQLHGKLHTNGEVKGNLDFMKIDGISDVAKSDTFYHVELTKFDPTSVIAKVKGAKLENILALLGEKPYAKADIVLDVNFKDIKPHHLDGDLDFHIRNSVIDYQIIQKEFGVDLPKTELKVDAKARLKGDEAVYMYDMDSNLAKIKSQGVLTPSPLALNLTYDISVKELALLRPLLKTPLRGKIDVKGKVKGTKEKLHVSGTSGIAGSNTVFDVEFADLKPKQIDADIKNIDLSKLLYMVEQPHYGDALIDAQIKIKDLKPFNGTVVSKITRGVLDTGYVSKTYGFKNMPSVTFNALSQSRLLKNSIDTAVDINSNLAVLGIKKASYDLQTKTLNSDYKVKIPDLSKLYFVTNRELKGSVLVDGSLKKDKNMRLTAHSDIFDGKVDALLHNDDLSANLENLQTLPLLKMLIYPEIFASSLDGKLNYNLAKKSGKFDAKLNDGHFTNNQMINLVKQYAKTDLYKEKFLGDLHADIRQENITASLHLNSNNAKIDTKNLKLNSKTKYIDADIRIEANKNPLTLSLKGNAAKPRIGIDATELIKKEAGKAIEKEVNKFLKGLF